MRPCAFDYRAPATLEEAVALLAEHAPDARVLAGGQSLIPAMNVRLARPSIVVDLGRVPGLDGVEQSGDSVTIGAKVTHAEIEASPMLSTALPMLPFMARHIGYAAIRNRGTVGGSLANADPASEWPCALLALDGHVKAVGPHGSRTIPSDAFFHSYYTTALEPDEILTHVVLPSRGEAWRWSFSEVARQPGAFALVLALACTLLSPEGEVKDVRLAIGGCGARPLLPVDDWTFLIGTRPSKGSVEEAVRRAVRGLDPHDDIHASAADRLQMAGTLAGVS